MTLARLRKPLAVVPTYVREPRELDVLEQALTTLAATADVDVLVVDDGSPAQELVDELDIRRPKLGLEFELVRKAENEGFATTVNVGLRQALDDGRDAVLVNADVIFHEQGWLDAMLATEGAVVGAKLLYPNGLIQHCGVFFSLLHRQFEHIYKYAPATLPESEQERVCPVTAALQLIRHETLTYVGLYDENFELGWEDVDYCLRVFMADRECRVQPRASAVHHESFFRSSPSPKIRDRQHRSWIYLMTKYKGVNFMRYVPPVV